MRHGILKGDPQSGMQNLSIPKKEVDSSVVILTIHSRLTA